MKRVDPIERHLFIEGILLRYGYDFRGYSEASLSRRLSSILLRKEKDSLLDVLRDALASTEYFQSILPMLTIGATEFFRDPQYYKALREDVLPVLASYPRIRIWIAGCSTGEEVVSVCILLKEAELLSRTTIFATDINPAVLATAKAGIYPLDSLKTFAKNYAQASGLKSPADYYSSQYGLVKFDETLLQNVVFSEHNLATDSNFTEAHLIICRNVIIYFNKELQNRVFRLFASSLASRGFLALGSKESIRFSSISTLFAKVNEPQRLFRLTNQASTSPQMPEEGRSS